MCMYIYCMCLMCMYLQGQIFQVEYPVLLDSEDVGNVLLRNVGKYSPNDTASQPRRIYSSQILWLVRLTTLKRSEPSDATRLWIGNFTAAHSKDASCMPA